MPLMWWLLRTSFPVWQLTLWIKLPAVQEAVSTHHQGALQIQLNQTSCLLVLLVHMEILLDLPREVDIAI